MMEDCPQVASVVADTTPEVSVETADDGDTSVYLTGMMFEDGLNKNAWGLTESGAEAIASSIVGRDFTASHPFIRNGQFDRAVHGGEGLPIGVVRDASVSTIEGATMEDVGGNYTAEYIAEILDVAYKSRFASGLLSGNNYGVSVGIYSSPEDAIGSVTGEPFEDSPHERGEKVDGQIAGPLYTDGEADHLAAVYLPAYDNATVDSIDGTIKDVTAGETTGCAAYASADKLFGGRFDSSTDADADENVTDREGGDHSYPVRIGSSAEASMERSFILNYD